MKYIPIDASFLNSCTQTFLDSCFYKPDDSWLFPITIKTCKSHIVCLVGQKKQLEVSQDSLGNGFIASFDLDSKLELFGYMKNNVLDVFVRLKH